MTAAVIFVLVIVLVLLIERPSIANDAATISFEPLWLARQRR